MGQLRQLTGQLIVAWKHHWPYYLTEAAGLACFVSCASIIATLVEHPALPVRQAIDSAVARRGVQGVAMGLVVVGIVYSPWGKRSGAHINPAITVAFWQLGRISRADAIWYVVAQLTGAMAAGQLMVLMLGRFYSHPSVHFNTTTPMPQPLGEIIAFGAEFVISFLLMLTMVWALQHEKTKDKTGWLTGGLIAVYILVESPFSGMSLNPARTLGTAVAGGNYHGLWVYGLAPPAAMWTVAILFQRFCGQKHVPHTLLTGCRPDARLPHYPQEATETQ